MYNDFDNPTFNVKTVEEASAENFQTGDYVIFHLYEDEMYPGKIVKKEKDTVIVEVCTDLGKSKDFHLSTLKGTIKNLERLLPKE